MRDASSLHHGIDNHGRTTSCNPVRLVLEANIFLTNVEFWDDDDLDMVKVIETNRIYCTPQQP